MDKTGAMHGSHNHLKRFYNSMRQCTLTDFPKFKVLIGLYGLTLHGSEQFAK